MDELTPETIAEAAAGAEQHSVDNQMVKVVPIPDQIAAAKFQAANRPEVRRRRNGGIRPIRFGVDVPD